MAVTSAFNSDLSANVETVLASDGAALPIGSLAHVYGRDASGNLTTDTVQFGGGTYIQTATYNGSNQQTGVSAWVKQP